MIFFFTKTYQVQKISTKAAFLFNKVRSLLYKVIRMDNFVMSFAHKTLINVKT